MSKVSLPAYRIEPPDLLQIEVLKLVPLPPYRVESYDVLQISVMGTLLDQPIDGYYLIEAEGTINLGPAYGTVRIAGMTIEEAKRAVTDQLLNVLREPQVSVQLARASGMQPITGLYLVGPDGTVNLRQYGVVHVAGKTMTEASLAIEQHLGQFFDSPERGRRHGRLQQQGVLHHHRRGRPGRQRRPRAGHGQRNGAGRDQPGRGLSQLSSKKIWIARPAPGTAGCEQILPVDWVAITRGGMTATNYQLMPGDRVFISEEPIVASTNFLARITAPVERLFGITGLGISTVRQSQIMGRSYNQFRSG